MRKQNVVVCIESPGNEPEVWGNFKKMCLEKGLPYHSLKVLKMPIYHEKYKIYRVPLL